MIIGGVPAGVGNDALLMHGLFAAPHHLVVSKAVGSVSPILPELSVKSVVKVLIVQGLRTRVLLDLVHERVVLELRSIVVPPKCVQEVAPILRVPPSTIVPVLEALP